MTPNMETSITNLIASYMETGDDAIGLTAYYLARSFPEYVPKSEEHALVLSKMSALSANVSLPKVR